MAHNKDDRTNNVDRIAYNIGKTIENHRLAEDMIETTSDEKMKETLKAKNERREQAINGMRNEIKDEAIDKQNGYR